MSKTCTLICLVFSALLMMDCAGDDSVNPAPLPTDASADAPADRTASDASSGGPDSDGNTNDATGD
jgi:hypothetical protein